MIETTFRHLSFTSFILQCLFLHNILYKKFFYVTLENMTMKNSFRNVINYQFKDTLKVFDDFKNKQQKCMK